MFLLGGRFGIYQDKAKPVRVTKSAKRSDGFGGHLSRAADEKQASQNQGSETRLANAIRQKAKYRYKFASISCDLKSDAKKASRCT